MHGYGDSHKPPGGNATINPSFDGLPKSNHMVALLGLKTVHPLRVGFFCNSATHSNPMILSTLGEFPPPDLRPLVIGIMIISYRYSQWEQRRY